MADITSVKLPNNSEYNIKDALAQPATLSAAITVDGTSQTTVEGALGAINTLAAANKSGKADKVTSPTSGDFAALDSSGNLTDSGKKAADFATDDEMSAVVDVLTAKNFIYYPYLGTVVGTGITWTDNGDGSVTANGTAGTGGCSYLLNSQASGKFVKKPAGTYKLTGCPSGGASNYWLVANMADNGTLMTMQDVGSGAERTFTTDMTIYTGEYIYLYVAEGKTVTNLTFYPMLRDARITDNTYVPYAKTNRELTVITEEKFDLLAESTTRETVVGISDLSNVLKKYKYLLCKANIVIDGVENYRGTQVMIPTIESRVLNAPINVCGGSDYWQGETYLYVILDQAYGGISYWWAHYNNTADRFTNVTYKFRVYGLN